MSETRVIQTSLGTVEVMYLPGDKPAVLFFPGGHCSATSDCGWSLYTSEGHGVLAFSRPGYGNTNVGRLTPAEFVPAVAESCEALAIDQTAGAVGISFGGPQAIHAAFYGLDDRYPGISNGRRVILVHPEDLAELGFQDRDLVDVVSTFRGHDRPANKYQLVAYPTAKGCAAACFPEANALVHKTWPAKPTPPASRQCSSGLCRISSWQRRTSQPEPAAPPAGTCQPDPG